MTNDDQIKDEKHNMISLEKLQKYHPYHEAKLLNTNILHVITGNILPSNQEQIIEQVKFIYSPLGKAFEN